MGSSRPDLAAQDAPATDQKKRVAADGSLLKTSITRSSTSGITRSRIGPESVHRLSAVRSLWAYGGPNCTSFSSASRSSCPSTSQRPAVNGGGLTTRRCRRRTSRAATTRASPFAANAAPAPAINDTPGSAESGGGGTISYRGPESGASSNSFTVITQAGSLRGSANRSTSARSPRAPRTRAVESGDNGGRSPSGTATREDEVGKPATSSKRKSSTSATRNESEARLRRQLQHNVVEKLERSEQARTELENRLALYQDVLSHRDQMINNVEVYSHQHHEEYQEHVNSEMELMRRPLIDAYNLLDEQSNALSQT